MLRVDVFKVLNAIREQKTVFLFVLGVPGALLSCSFSLYCYLIFFWESTA